MHIFRARLRGELDQVLLKPLKNHPAALGCDRHRQIGLEDESTASSEKRQSPKGRHFNTLLTGFC
jgi:hypothetical protein